MICYARFHLQKTMNNKEITFETKQVKNDSEIILNQATQDFPPTDQQTLDLELSVQLELDWQDNKFQCDIGVVKLRSLSGQKLHIVQRNIAVELP